MATKRKKIGSSAETSDAVGESGRGEFRGGGTVKTALIRGNTFAAKAVQYVELDGLCIFEGDIVLGTAEEVAQMTEQMRAEMVSGIASGVIITGAQFRWPNCRIPFTIDPALPDQNRVTEAIAHWEANSGFRFVTRTTEVDFVTFRPGSGCSSQVGRRGGQQFVNLAPGCDRGRTIHEIGHVVGLWHEQSREDRDLFVTINFAKIIPGMEHNFDQHVTDGDDVGAYDFGSIMHYPRDAFSIDGGDTITPIVPLPPGVVMGQRNGLSSGDIAAAKSLCFVTTSPTTTQKEPISDITVHETAKEQVLDTLKEPIHDATVLETAKELVLDTRKEQIFDTVKEQIRDTLKEGTFDPGPTLAESVITPGRPPVLQPGLVTPGGVRPFAVITPLTAAQAPMGAAGLQHSIAQLDAQLQQIAEQLAQADAAKESLQGQYNERWALLAQLIQERDQSTG
jgi:Astacin (Peptidase family M12A)